MEIGVFKRTQFKFEACDDKLSCLLTLNVKECNRQVNVVAISSNKTKCNKNIVKIIVGNPDPCFKCDNKKQEKQFRKNLEKLDICYKEKQILQVVSTAGASGTPGATRVYITALTCENIKIKSIYYGELVEFRCESSLSNFIEVSKCQFNQAKCILKNLCVDKKEKELCVNKFNVEKKCKSCNCTCNK